MVKRLILAVLVLILGFGFSFAQEQQAEVSKDATAQKLAPAMPQGKDVMMNSKFKKGAMSREGMRDMMKMMMPKSMVSTSDGGVIVLIGNKLLKYDSKLDLVKEVEINSECPNMPKPNMEMDKSGMDLPGKDMTEESK
jgi:hypothetical protein